MTLPQRIGLALLAALALGALIAAVDTPVLNALPPLVEPLGALWVNAIRMTVVPLVVALVITGIASARDTRTVGRIGGGAILLFVLFIAAVALFTVLVAPPLLMLLPVDTGALEAFRTTAAQAGAATELPPFRDWLVELIPPNPMQAAADGAMLPLLVFAALFGLALTRTRSAGAGTVVAFFQGVVDATFVLVHWILELAPIGVFGLVLPLAATLGVGAAAAFGGFVVLAVALVLVVNLALYPVTVLAAGIPLGRFARGCLPAQVVGFSTRSSLASLPAMIEGAEERLGLPTQVTGLALPAAVSVFKFASPAVRLTGTLFVARLYGIELGGLELAVVASSIALLSFYSPGIPSGGLFVMTPVYLAFGLPVEGIGLLIALDMIPDMFITVANVTADLSVAAILTRWVGVDDPGGPPLDSHALQPAAPTATATARAPGTTTDGSAGGGR
ncbi:MAG: dicarboxylate/amino acid:cation symporter [Gemmatimonadota bacterium]